MKRSRAHATAHEHISLYFQVDFTWILVFFFHFEFFVLVPIFQYRILLTRVTRIQYQTLYSYSCLRSYFHTFSRNNYNNIHDKTFLLRVNINEENILLLRLEKLIIITNSNENALYYIAKKEIKEIYKNEKILILARRSFWTFKTIRGQCESRQVSYIRHRVLNADTFSTLFWVDVTSTHTVLCEMNYSEIVRKFCISDSLGN